MSKTIILLSSLLVFAACGGEPKTGDSEAEEQTPRSRSETADDGNPSYDPNRGEGKFTHVDVGETLDAALATKGDNVQGVKCSACHKLTSERLVGPGWEGVTQRRRPEWIMNFITNPDPMIDKDPSVQADLELCLVRMPNQSLSDDDARAILEFMRKNDGVK